MSCDFYRKETPIARKEHRCSLCRQPIYSGKKYAHVICKCSGYDIYDSKLHEICEDLIERYLDNNKDDDEFNEDMVLEDISETVCSECPEKDDCEHGYFTVVRCPNVIDTYLKSDEPNV